MITEYAPAPTQPRTGSTMTDLPLIELVQPLAGFPELRSFALVQLDEAGLLCAFRSVEDPDTRFLVVPPHAFFPAYAPVLEDDVVDGLGIESVDDVLLLVVVTARTSLADSTANLAAPLVINVATRRAQQVVLDDITLQIATPLVAA
jgi:flagellar assembly factor FliW